MKAPASRVELAFSFALCLLAALGIGLACASAAVGVATAIVGAIAVAAYGATGSLHRWTLARLERSHRLSVTEISSRRRQTPAAAPSPPVENTEAFKTAGLDRVVPLKMHVVR